MYMKKLEAITAPFDAQPTMSLLPIQDQVATPRSPAFLPVSWWQRWLRKRIVSALSKIPGDSAILLEDADGIFPIGSPEQAPHQATISVHDPRAYTLMAMQGSLGASEAYLRGWWSTGELLTLLRIFTRHCDAMCAMDKGLASFATLLSRWAATRRRNSKAGSQRNIAEHYDLSNEFFSLFLDPRMMYSSACFFTPDMKLEEAALAKLKHVCRKLRLEPGDHLMEIGTGWGGLASHAAREHGCKVTTTTISRQQHDYAQQLFADHHQADMITLLQQDYRDLKGQYDKLVSIEMIEAVGRQYLDEYFRCCNRLLKPGGRMLIQAIVIPEQRYDIYCKSVDFIQAYIFPGSFLPSIASMQQAVGRGTSLRLVSVEDFTPSYARTLHAWRDRFLARLEDVRKLGFDDRFIRMWDFYLTSCEAVFHERAASLVQLEWIKL